MQTLKGFRDFLPEKMAIRTEVIRRLRSVFERYGFEELQTPVLEYSEVLLGKYGEEVEKLMYLFQDPGGRDVGMRYDLTVPLARVVSTYQDLPKPFKRYQIQQSYRAENTQKGRYREFYQCDVDIVGSTSPLADAEILAVINDSLRALEFPNYTIRVNSRQVLFSIMEAAGIERDKWLTTIQSIDKLDKKSRFEVEEELRGKGLQSNKVTEIFNSIEKAKPDEFLEKVLGYAKSLGADKNVKFDPTVARGLDYYTGPIFESVVEKPKIGSVTGGGRYDELLKALGGPDLPATGTTVGLDRVCDVIEELNLWPDVAKSVSQILVTIFNPELLLQSVKLAAELRKNGINTELYPDDSTKMEKQLKYADKKRIPFIAIIGPDEASKDVIQLKNMQSGEQETLTIKELIKVLG